MPIKDKSLYPKNWKEIRAQILERAGHRCEECGVKNYALGVRVNGEFLDCTNYPMQLETFVCADELKPIKIVLTIAHLDHNPQNNDPSNLKALCQMHHLRRDAEHHAKNAAKTRAMKKQRQIKSTGQLAIFAE